MNTKTAVCPLCNMKILFNKNVSWNSGYIKCPACGKRVYVFLANKESKDKNNI